jgi:predicted dehydrogenase
MVDHTFAYHGAVRIIRDLIAAGELGTVYYYDSVRVNLGLFHSDANVLWDLAVHDLSILTEVLPERPVAVSALGKSHFEGRPENIAYLTLFFAGTAIAHLHVNWLAPVKVRRTLIGGSRRMIVYDDLEPSEKVKVYDCGVTVSDDPESRYRARYDYRVGGMTAPQFDTAEPLRRMVEHFLDCVRDGAVPRTDGRAGLAIVRILEAAKASMDDGGRPVALTGEDD